jgi:hypothetical protein
MWRASTTSRSSRCRSTRPARGQLNAYFIELKYLDAIDARSSSSIRSILFSLQWKHNGSPPDFEMVQIQDEPVGWVNTANLTLLAELRRRAPEAIDWAGMQDVVPLLDAFEAAQAT